MLKNIQDHAKIVKSGRRGRGKLPLSPYRIYDRYIPVTETGCWLWEGGVCNKKTGYGYVSIYGNNEFVHRVSWVLTYGDIPEGYCVLHRCDVPACINPDHLFLGTHADNMKDMSKKGRGKSGNTKITRELALKIREEYENTNMSTRKLAAKYELSKSGIFSIVSGRYWK